MPPDGDWAVAKCSRELWRAGLVTSGHKRQLDFLDQTICILITREIQNKTRLVSSGLAGGNGEVVGELVVRSLANGDDVPEVGGLELVGLGEGSNGSLEEVALGGGVTLGLGVAVLDTGELEHALGSGGSDNAGTAGSGDETAHDGARLAGDLHGDGVGLSDVRTPVAATDGDDRELGEDDGTADGTGDLLGALDTETDVAVEVTDSDEGLEAGALTGGGLLLNGHDLHNLVLEGGEEEVDDLVLLDGEREEVDLLHGLDLAVLHKTTELGNGDPTCQQAF